MAPLSIMQLMVMATALVTVFGAEMSASNLYQLMRKLVEETREEKQVARLVIPDWSYSESLKKCSGVSVFFEELTEIQAQRKCLDLNANLVSVLDETMNEAITKMIDGYTGAWIGLVRVPGGPPYTFSWLNLDDELVYGQDGNSQTPEGFQNWDSSQPLLERSEAYVEMKNGGKWAVVDNKWETRPAYVCQAPCDTPYDFYPQQYFANDVSRQMHKQKKEEMETEKFEETLKKLMKKLGM